MFKKFFEKLNHNLGIDLGTTKTMIYRHDRGIAINESSIVAINNRTDQILAVGDEARKMIGKTPPHILATAPLEKGVISNFEVTEKMLKYFIDRLQDDKFSFSRKPKAVIGIPLDVTEVEKKAVEDVAASAGCGQTYLVENVMAAAIGARIPIQDPTGNMVVNLGGGLTEVAVISLSGIVNWKVSDVAGLTLDKDIIRYARDEFGLVLGEMVAEDIKKKIGSTSEFRESISIQMRGRDVMTGLPREIEVNQLQIQVALARSVDTIVDTIKSTLETTPPELVADIYQRGIVLTGGTSQLKGLDKLIAQIIQIPVHVADDPETCTIRGMGLILDDENLLKDIAIPSSQ
jgi:rod shape-determining protein MreB